MKNKTKITIDGSDYLFFSGKKELIVEFLSNIEYMQQLYKSGKFTKAEQIKENLIESLSDLMEAGYGEQ